MGWKPALRWDRHCRRWHFRFGGKHYACGRDWLAAAERFRQITSLEPGSAQSPGTVAGIVLEWSRIRQASDWQHAAADRLVGWCGRLELPDVKPTLLTRYVEHLQSVGLKPRTILSYMKVANQIFRHAASRGWIAVPPTMPKMPKPKPALKSVSTDTLAAAFADLPSGARGILRFILHTGCRPAEACRLKWSDVDLAAGVCRIAKHKTDRYGQERVLYLTPEARAAIESSERIGDYVWNSWFGRPYSPAGLRSILRRRGIDGAYALRHTFAQHALDSGVDWATLARMMGHADLQTVSHYARIRDQQAIRAAESLPSPLPTQPQRPVSDGSAEPDSAESPAPRTRKAKRMGTQ